MQYIQPRQQQALNVNLNRNQNIQFYDSSLKQRQKQRCILAKLFTGIVQGTAQVASIETPAPDTRQFRINFPPKKLDHVQRGASIAINGTCLTVTEFKEEGEGRWAIFDVIDETLKRTNLGRLEVGTKVNFERSARLGDEIGGHTVSGHVHCVATISNVTKSEGNVCMRLEVGADWVKYIISKGFISVDGISLTVGDVGPTWFEIHLIPETLNVTILGGVGVGQSCNIEIDAQTMVTVDTIERVLAQYKEQGKL